MNCRLCGLARDENYCWACGPTDEDFAMSGERLERERLVREIYGHESNEANRAITVHADAVNPDNGNASHRYDVACGVGPDGHQLAHFTLKFQDGPIKEVGVNGLTNEVLLAIVGDRLQCFQSSKYACQENADALQHVGAALYALHERTKKREERGVEGTHTV